MPPYRTITRNEEPWKLAKDVPVACKRCGKYQGRRRTFGDFKWTGRKA